MSEEPKPKVHLVIVSMNKPHAIVYVSRKKPTNNQVLETFSDLIKLKLKDLHAKFDIQKFDIEKDIVT